MDALESTKDIKFPQMPGTGTENPSHSELPGYEAAHEVESPQPPRQQRSVVEMAGEGEPGYLSRNEGGREGMHEMAS